MKRWLLLGALGAGLLLLAGSAVLFVDQAEYVYVTTFGRHVATYDGGRDAGLQLKWPWPVQTAWRLDRRLQVFDVPTQELLIRDYDEKTREPKALPLTFDVYVCWRIADPAPGHDPVDRFVRRFGVMERAQGFLRSQIISRLKVELSDVPLADLVTTGPRRPQIDALMSRVRTQRYALSTAATNEPELSLVDRARQDGIELVDIRLRRFNHPVQVREEIFAKIREDRRREANNYKLQGEELAAAIKAEGELEAKRIRAEAEAYRLRREGDARAEATRILNDAHKEAPELYRTVRLLEGYRRMFADDKTQLILSLDHPLLALFKDLPRLRGSAGGKPADANGPAGNGNDKAKKEMP